MVPAVHDHRIAPLRLHVLKVSLRKADLISTERERQCVLALHENLISIAGHQRASVIQTRTRSLLGCRAPGQEPEDRRLNDRKVLIETEMDPLPHALKALFRLIQRRCRDHNLPQAIAAVRVRVDVITGLHIEHDLPEPLALQVVVLNFPECASALRVDCARKHCPLASLRKEMRDVLAERDAEQHLVVIDAVGRADHLRKTVRAASSRELNDIDLVAPADKVAVDRAVVEAERRDRTLHLLTDLSAERLLIAVRHGMTERQGRRAVEGDNIVRLHVENFPILDHGLDAENLALNEFLDEAVVLMRLGHRLRVVSPRLLRRVAPVDAPASHEVDSLHDDRKMEPPDGSLELILAVHAAKRRRLDSRGDKCLLHKELVGRLCRCLLRRPRKAERLGRRADRAHTEIEAAGHDSVDMVVSCRAEHRVRISDIVHIRLVGQLKARIRSRNAHRHSLDAYFSRKFIERCLRVAGTENQKFFHFQQPF